MQITWIYRNTLLCNAKDECLYNCSKATHYAQKYFSTVYSLSIALFFSQKSLRAALHFRSRKHKSAHFSRSISWVPMRSIRCFSVVESLKSRLGKLALSVDGCYAQFLSHKRNSYTLLWGKAYLYVSHLEALFGCFCHLKWFGHVGRCIWTKI